MKRKTTFFLIVITAISFTILQLNVNAQSPHWQWAKSAGGAGVDDGNAIAVDTHGNSFVAGNFNSSSITFGSTTLTNASAGTNDIFIAKYDSSGNVLWATSAGGDYEDYSNSIGVDENDNIYVCGTYRSHSITFGAFTLTNPNYNNSNFYMVKYNASGNVVWLRSGIVAGGIIRSNSMPSLVVTPTAIYGAGQFQCDTFQLGSTILINVNPTNEDMFIVKYDTAGNVKWAKSAGGSGNDYAYGVFADAKDNVAATGIFDSPSLPFGSTTLVNASAGTNDIFTVKYDSSGNVIWAKSAGGTDDDYGNSMGIDAAGNIYVCGTYKSSSITFGAFTLTNPNPPNSNFYMVKYNASGNVVWLRSGIVTGSSIISNSMPSLFVAPTGIYGAGQFQCNTFQLGSTVLTNVNPTNEDMFIVKYDTAGNVKWAESAGGSGNDYAYCVSSNNNGNVGITGIFDSSTLPIGTTTLVNAASGLNDVFVANLYEACNLVVVPPLSTTICGGDSAILTATGAQDYMWSPATGLTTTTGSTVTANPTVTTTYTITYTDNGCQTTAQCVVTVQQPPNKPIITLSVTGDTLFSNARNGNHWYVNGTLINGATDSFYVIKGLPVGDSIKVQVIDIANGCSSTSGTFVTGINQLAINSNQLSVYPNPISDQLTIESGQIVVNSVTITNLLGQVVYDTPKSPVVDLNGKTINVSPLTNGLYFVTMISGSETITKKIIVSR